MTEVSNERPSEEDKLVAYFRGDGFKDFGSDGDYNGWTPAETAINAMRELSSLRQSHSTGVVVNAALVERFQSAYRDAGQKRNWHPTWPDAEASFEILSALHSHPKEAEVTVTEEMVDRFDLEWDAAARPPGHPEPMRGKQSFPSLDKAVEFMRRQAEDARPVSLVRVRSEFSDQTAALVAALSRKG